MERDPVAAPMGNVWLSSYPKSGNTWVRCLIACLRSGDGSLNFGRLSGASLHPVAFDWLEDTLDIDAAEMRPSELAAARASAYRLIASGRRHLCKLHDRYKAALFPPEATAGTVYIVRDPRDVAPSLAHHMNLSLDDAITFMGDAQAMLGVFKAHWNNKMPQRLGRWSDHAASWLEGHTSPLLLLRYEDMLRDTAGETCRLARFLGLPDDPATVDRVVDTCRFDRLQQRERETGFAERLDHMDRFFRQGEAGAWRRTLTVEQVARIVRDHGPMMERLGYL